MAEATLIQRPQRWDSAFDPNMAEEDVERILAVEPFASMDASKFPPAASLRDIIRNDTRIHQYQPGNIIMRQGDYGSSAFLVLKGRARVVLNPPLPDRVLGRQVPIKKGHFEAFSQLWRNPRQPEVRDLATYRAGGDVGTRRRRNETLTFLQDVPAIISDHQTDTVGEGEIFGEIAALGRTPRTATIFADGKSDFLEIRWQGLRDIRRRDEALRDHIDQLYRERSLQAHFRSLPMFGHLSDWALDKVAEETVFETYGEFDWHGAFKKMADRGLTNKLAHEPVIAEEGEYADCVFFIRAGFARVSQRINHGHRTANFLGRGDFFGFREVAHNWRTGEQVGLQYSLRALGYVDVLRVPTAVIEALVLPSIEEGELPELISKTEVNATDWEAAAREVAPDASLLEFLVENLYVNGTATMMIDLDRCVRCDDCVSACAAGHNNNPRFIRHGKRHGRFMVANACMHCSDPVCMIGCPTGAIHRTSMEGQVVINDATCIGCATCANSCPYDNIRMVDIRDVNGNFILDEETNRPIVKASKCDLCVDQMEGPACQRACPHDALRRVDMRDLRPIVDWLA